MRLRDLGGLIVIDFIDMEQARNQKDVEQRLKDGLRYDRARVQTGKISRFGLMELSRQRLRPSLSEGSHVVCPRCNGTGHIRDIESSALHVLRIIQEEAMKENTAAVHTQVPVEVATFLLNEKRTDIATIEARLKVNVVLIPNKNLDTPHYTLERLKHDDPRLDNIEASYKMAEEMEDATTVTRRNQEKHNKQEPVIKGVLPDAPAPAAVPRPVVMAPVALKAAAPAAAPAYVPAPVAPPAEKGLFGWIKTLFNGPEADAPTPAAPIAQEVKKDERPADARREGRPAEGRADRGGRDGRRGGRSRGEGAEGRSEGRSGERRERNPEGRAEGVRPERQERPERQPGELRAENRNESRADNNGEGQPRNENPAREGRGERGRSRGDRPERADRGERVARDPVEQDLAMANQAAMAAAASGDAAPAPRQDRAPGQDAARDAERRPGARSTESRPEGRGEEAGEGRRDRGERGGERNPRRNERRDEQPAALAGLNGSANTAAPEIASGGEQIRPEGQDESQERPPRRSRDRYGRERRERMDRGEPATEAGAVAAKPAFAEPHQAFTQQERALPATESVAPVAAPFVAPAVIVAAPVATPKPPAAAQSAPAPASAAASALPKVQSYDLPMQDLARVAESSGLQWINSDATRVAEAKAAMAAEATPIVVRRERPGPVPAEETPLVLVETRRDLGNMPLPFEKSAD